MLVGSFWLRQWPKVSRCCISVCLCVMCVRGCLGNHAQEGSKKVKRVHQGPGQVLGELLCFRAFLFAQRAKP